VRIAIAHSGRPAAAVPISTTIETAPVASTLDAVTWSNVSRIAAGTRRRGRASTGASLERRAGCA